MRILFHKIFNLKEVTFEEYSNAFKTEEIQNNPENQIYHSEKDTEEHIWNVVQRVWEFIEIMNPPEYIATALYMAAFFHDIKKPKTISYDEFGIVHNYDHEIQAARYLWDYIEDAGIILTPYALDITRLASRFIQWHMLIKSARLEANPMKDHLVNSFTMEELPYLVEFASLDSPGINHKAIHDYIIQRKYQVVGYRPERDNPKLYLMSGPIASGKSYLAKQLMNEDFNAEIVSTDGIREELFGHKNTTGKGSEVFGEAYTRTKELLSFGKKNVIFDATNFNFRLRQNICGIAQQRQIPIVIYYFVNSLKTCLLQNSKRKDPIPDDVIIKMYNQVEMPSYLEGNEIILKGNLL